MITLFLILFGLYFICMMILVYGFNKVPMFHSEENLSKTRFSIVIPFRNESKNLPSLLKSIFNLKYPSTLFEVIFVNDASEDNSVEIIMKAKATSELNIRLIQNKLISKSPKKDAITEAIKNAKYQWIVTTDADCELSENWLSSLDAYFQKLKAQQESLPVMVCGPVLYKTDNSFLENFQFLDGLSLQAVTIGSFGLQRPILCNGANLAYQKNAFEKVNGFKGNDHISSGDDIFLMEKMQKAFKGKIAFLKSRQRIVLTKPQASWKDAISQRIRWASKTSKQKNPLSIFLGVLVFLMNVLLLTIPVLLFLLPEYWVQFVILFYLKALTDFAVIKKAGMFFNRRISLIKFQWMPLVYAVITVRIVLGSFKGSYVWKDRNY
ncbi:glycosyltransferase family 2 protein [Aequorivita viscosa]|uniref:Glycosyltransferase, catalytic subunit of cellulose synthase and poly-beta-1,6-N-acetylglucosamine synthase n=1 Tax=Aequorivita viscosa TaxID=797419 RepID=A0A1M6L5A9_9FLAO|nr:glycosyltransferase [Aequorivita viscosa]SDX23184.1 Glycosyltransferase, catalytic subunit of cellulose synthase and poly-beta-1,6-N-acetylglucosamine synthase [Aequorivita viscosa]SHJ66381.1 Glycosyltransferase, catalytic subunit of cellulose synthase and poly-beta-1,6-N-acetylglucosamine synthase [Aequorivita viscosa]